MPEITYEIAAGDTLNLAIKQKLLNYIIQKLELFAGKIIPLVLRFTELYNLFGISCNIRLIAKGNIILIRRTGLIKFGASKIFTNTNLIFAEILARIRGILRNL